MAASARLRPRPDAPSALREADSGIQVAIQQVHEDVERDEEDRDGEDAALHERVIALHDGREEHAADTGDGEYLFDDDGTAEELTDLNPEERHDDDQPVLEDVAPEDETGPQPLRARGAHVVGAQHVEHRGARHTHRRRREREAERDRGEDLELQIAERIVDEIDVPTGVREPAQVEREEDDDQRPEPEARQGQADEAADARSDVDARARADRRQQSERYAEGDRDERGGRGELERRGEALGDLDEDGTSGADRVPSVTVEERAEPIPVLDEERLVEAEVRTQARELLGRERRRRAESRRDGVAGDEPDEQEREERDADEGRDRAEQSLREITTHASRSERSLLICRARSAVGRSSIPSGGG